MVGVIDGFRWSILGGTSPLYLPGLYLSQWYYRHLPLVGRNLLPQD